MLVRVTGTLSKPWNLVENELCHLFSDPSVHDTQYTWEALIAKVFLLTLTVDKASGDLEITVGTPVPYLSSSIIAAVSTVLIVLFYPRPAVLFLAMAACLVLLLLAAIPGIVILPRYLYMPTSDFLSVEQGRLSRVTFIPLSGWVVGSAFVLGADSLLLPALILGCLLVVLYAYASTISLTALRRQALLLAISTLTLLPLILSVGNLAFIDLLAEGTAGMEFVLAVSFFIVNTVAIMAVYIWLCQILLDWAQHIPNRAVDSVFLRFAWGGLILGLNISSVLLVPVYLFGVGFSSGGGVPVVTLATEFATVGLLIPHLFAWAVTIILASPFLVVCFLWVFHLYRELQKRRLLSKTVEFTDINTDVPVHVLETNHAQAYAHTTLTGQDKIVITSGLREQLEPQELQAVIEHEKYHLENRDPMRIAVGTIFGLLFGGKNAIVVLFDFPAIEIKADRYAADQVGTTSMVRALRRLERARPSEPMTQPSFVAGPPFISQQALGISNRIFWPPYYVLFGNVVSESAHPTIDDRIAFILDDTD